MRLKYRYRKDPLGTTLIVGAICWMGLIWWIGFFDFLGAIWRWVAQ